MKFNFEIVIFLLSAFAYTCTRSESDTLNLNKSAEQIKRHTEILSSDIFKGRGTGTTGGNLAAKYIASEFAKYGLKPIGQENSFYQNIQMHGSYPLNSSELKLYKDNSEILLKLEKDYLMFKSGQQTFLPVLLPLIFVGYGIVAPEFDYNDYQSVDVEGKIVVFLEGEPESDDSDFFNGEQPTIYSYTNSKQRIAIARGAAGSILIPDNSKNWEKLVSDFSFEDVSLAYSASNNLSILINPKSINYLFQNSEYSFLQILQMKHENRLVSFPLKTELTFKGEYIQRDFLAQNVAAIVDGNDPILKDSYLILSAHYDHLGIGPVVKGDSIYNGALDNAIGVGVLLELARRISEKSSSIRRSIIFLALTGEEKGLLGSSYYTDNPLVPLYKTIANVNIDGIALFKDFQSIIGVGGEYSTLGNYLLETAKKMNLDVDSIPAQFKSFEAFNQSDQISFATAGVPSILILEGIKNKSFNKDYVINSFIDYMVNRYHTPFDDLSQDIDFLAAARHLNILFEFVLNLADSENTPDWKNGSPFINERLRSIAEKK